MALSVESLSLSKKPSAGPYQKRPKSLYKKYKHSLKLSIDTFNLNQLDLLADSSNIYQQEIFAREPVMDHNLIDADRHSIISLENDTFQIIRPASFSVNKPKALYRKKESQSKFSVLQMSDKVDQVDVQICEPIQFTEMDKNADDLLSKEKKPLKEEVKVNTNSRSAQTVDKLVKNASTETDRVVKNERHIQTDKVVKNASTETDKVVKSAPMKTDKVVKNASTETDRVVKNERHIQTDKVVKNASTETDRVVKNERHIQTDKVFKNASTETDRVVKNERHIQTDKMVKNAPMKTDKVVKNASTETDKVVKNAPTEIDKVDKERNGPKSIGKEEKKMHELVSSLNADDRYVTDDDKSVEFDDNKTLVEQKLKIYYPFKIGIFVCIFLFLSSAVQVVLQLVLSMDQSPLNSVCAGVWSGFVGLLVVFSHILIILKRKFILFILSIILNCIGICVFIALAVINSISIRMYESCSTCSNLVGLNIALMILAVISFSVCFVFLIKIKIDIY